MAELLASEQPQRNGLLTEVVISRALAVLAVLGIVAALYVAKAIFLPLALAILLTFLLAPAVRLLRNWGVPRVPTVVLVVAFAGAVFLGIGALVGQQVTQLAQKLPEYQFTIQEKIRSVRDAASGGGLERISTFLRNGNQEIRKHDDQSPQGVPGASGPAPIPVEVHQPEPPRPQVIQRAAAAGRAAHHGRPRRDLRRVLSAAATGPARSFHQARRISRSAAHHG